MMVQERGSGDRELKYLIINRRAPVLALSIFWKSGTG